jgi:hypothetical protein
MWRGKGSERTLRLWEDEERQTVDENENLSLAGSLPAARCDLSPSTEDMTHSFRFGSER